MPNDNPKLSIRQQVTLTVARSVSLAGGLLLMLNAIVQMV